MTAPTPPPATTTTSAARPRGRRVVVGLLLGVPLAAPAALWVAALWVAERKLDAAVAAARAAGEPLAVKAPPRPPRLPDNANAAVILRSAEAAANINPQQDTLSTNLLNDIAGPNQAAAVRQLVAANRRTLQLSREARRVGEVDWGVYHSSYIGSPVGPGGVYSWRPQTLLLYDAAWLAHQDGDDAAAVEYLLDLLFVEQAMADYPVMNSHVWAGFAGMAVAKRVEDTGHAIRIGPGARAATVEQVRALTMELLDESHVRRAYATQMRHERSFWLDHTKQLSSANPLYRPVIRRDAVRVMEAYGQVVKAVEQPDWPKARAELGDYRRQPVPRSLPGGYSVEQFARPISPMFSAIHSGPAYDRHVQAEHLFHHVALKRMGAAALAVALYRADHDGAVPETLDALVPKYLPAVPLDPYVADGAAAVGYLPEATPPMLYCVGVDGVLNFPTNPPTPTFFDRYADRDLVLFLGPPPAVKAMVPPAPAGDTGGTTGSPAQGGGEDADPADQPGDDQQEQGGIQPPNDRE